MKRETGRFFAAGSRIWAATLLMVCIAGAGGAYAACDCSQTAVTGVPRVECEALVALYNSTNGPGWSTLPPPPPAP